MLNFHKGPMKPILTFSTRGPRKNRDEGKLYQVLLIIFLAFLLEIILIQFNRQLTWPDHTSWPVTQQHLQFNDLYSFYCISFLLWLRNLLSSSALTADLWSDLCFIFLAVSLVKYITYNENTPDMYSLWSLYPNRRIMMGVEETGERGAWSFILVMLCEIWSSSLTRCLMFQMVLSGDLA